MKNLRVILALLVLAFASANLSAQLTYQQVYSNPSDVYTGYAAIHYFGVDAGFGNTSGASIWSVGGEALYPINDNLRIEAVGLYSLLSLEKDGLPFLFNGGAEYKLSSKTKQKKVPVLLAFSYEKDYINNKEIQTWSSVTLPGDVTRELVARGGIYLRNSALEYEENNTFFDITNIFHAGVYAGIGYTKKHYMHVMDSDGYKFAYARQVRPFFDLLVLPTSVDLTDTGSNTNTTAEGTLGWRAGLTWQMTPFTKKENFDRKIGFFGNLLYRFEIGNRPIEGIYVTTSLAWTIKKFK